MNRKKDQLLFIGGFPSGGTDLMKTVLNAHPSINIAGEIQLLPTLGKFGYSSGTVFENDEGLEIFRMQLRSIDYWNRFSGIDCSFDKSDFPMTMQHAVMVFLGKTQSEPSIVGSKTPQFTENIGALIDLFPDAKFVIVVRDVRDIALSVKKKWGKDIYWCAHKWAERMKAATTWSEKRPQQVKLIKFEDLLGYSKSTLTEICTFLEVEFSERMLRHHEYTESQDGKINYGQPLKSSNKEKWRKELSPKQAKRLEEIAYETLLLYSYDISEAVNREGITKLELKIGKLNDAIAMLLVGNRTRNNNGLRQRLIDVRDQYLRLRKGA